MVFWRRLLALEIYSPFDLYNGILKKTSCRRDLFSIRFVQWTGILLKPKQRVNWNWSSSLVILCFSDHPCLPPIWSWRRWLFVNSLDCRRWLLSVVVSVTSLPREFDNLLQQPHLLLTMLSSEALVRALGRQSRWCQFSFLRHFVIKVPKLAWRLCHRFKSLGLFQIFQQFYAFDFSISFLFFFQKRRIHPVRIAFLQCLFLLHQHRTLHVYARKEF